MSGVKRYNLWRVDYDGRECDPLKEEDERGDWVAAEDYGHAESRLHEVATHCATVEQERDTLRTANQRLEGEVNRLKRLLNLARLRACERLSCTEEFEIDAALAGAGADDNGG